MDKSRRKSKLIKPWLQLKSALVFLAIAALVVVVQAVNLVFTLTDVAVTLPDDGVVILNDLSRIVTTNVAVTVALLVPLMLAVGVLVTFRIAGPLYRLEEHLKDVLSGERSEPCTLRKGDSLGELCELINRATEGLRGRAAETEDRREPEVASLVGTAAEETRANV